MANNPTSLLYETCTQCQGAGQWVDPVSRYGIASVCPKCRGAGQMVNADPVMPPRQFPRMHELADIMRGYYNRHGHLPTNTGLDLLDLIDAMKADK